MVEDQGGLDSLISYLKADTGPIAIDAERASGFRYSQRAYLIQLSLRDQEIYMLDPIQLEETSPGWNSSLAPLINPRTWMLHAATQDLPCLAELGFTPSSIIDTELAASNPAILDANSVSMIDEGVKPSSARHGKS